MRIAGPVIVSSETLDSKGKVMHELVGSSPELGGAATHSAFYVVIRPGNSFPAHYHKVHEETYYVLCGAAYVIVDGNRSSLGPGQAVLMIPGEIHEIGCAGEEELCIFVVTSPPFDPDDVYVT